MPEYIVSSDDGSRSGTKIVANSREEAKKIFEQQTGKKAVHVCGNMFDP